MTPRLVSCTKCRTPLPIALYNTGQLGICPSCRARLQVEVFPAALHPTGPGVAAEAVVMDGEASCFYHPAKRAVVPCDNCGRFLCAVCDVEMSGQHLCPGCIESGKKKGRIQKLETRRMVYDRLALALTLYPLLIAPVTIICAPMALYIVIRRWNVPSSVVQRSRWRMVLAAILALFEIAVWVAIFTGAFGSRLFH
jgi:hypothetical protein